MKTLIKYYFESYRNILGALNEDYNKRIHIARNMRDVHFTVYNEAEKQFREIQTERNPCGWEMYSNIKTLLSANKHLTIDEAILEYTKADVKELRKEKIKQVATLRAYSKFTKNLYEINCAYKAEDDKKYYCTGTIEEIKKVEINWTNGTNTTDFVKVIYSLHKAGLINNGKGEITKIVEYLGHVFNAGLKDWQSNHSSSKHNRNTDYNHFKIFDKMRAGYSEYLEEKDK